jgi:pilus assembly protein CpaF
MNCDDTTQADFGSAWESFQGRVILHLMKEAAPLLMPENGITEIMINGPDQVFFERAGTIEKTNIRFEDAAAVRALARAILQYSGKRLSEFDLSVEARLPDLSRVHIVQDPAAHPFRTMHQAAVGQCRPGICIAIRRFQHNKLGLQDLIASGSLSQSAADFLVEQVQQKRNIIISGGTGTGKTTLLNILSENMRRKNCSSTKDGSQQDNEFERIIVIEDSSELQIRLPHVVQFETVQPDIHNRGGISIRDLFRAALRMRPDRIIVGECRGGEALDMIQAMNSGHAGSLSTVHADSPARALSRLETLCMMSDVEMPLAAIRRQLGEAIDIIVQVDRIGRDRRVTQIAKVVESDDMPTIETVEV